MKKVFLLHIVLAFLLLSCKSTQTVSHGRKPRVVKYDFIHPDIPNSFEGFRILFATDFHYKSKFKEKQLKKLVTVINQLDIDLLLLGGDYQEGCEYVSELASELSKINAPYGKLGVLGNNDYERCYDLILQEMTKNGIRILEHENDTIYKEERQIIISGVRNPFDLAKNGKSPTLQLHDNDFVILLTHTPDYVEDTDITNTDLALAGHTHGGQITLFGLYAPVTASKYGQRFLRGKKTNSAGTPIIISRGLGTSRRNLRLFAPTDIILIILHPQEKE